MAIAFPPGLRATLKASRSRSQPAAFTIAEPRRGTAYVQEIGTDTPVFFDVEFAYTRKEALAFQLWFTFSLRRGVLEFVLPIDTEFGVQDHTCRFLPDSLLDPRQVGDLWIYRAKLMARAQMIPAEYEAAADLIAGLPDWTSWAALLDPAVNVEMPAS